MYCNIYYKLSLEDPPLVQWRHPDNLSAAPRSPASPNDLGRNGDGAGTDQPPAVRDNRQLDAGRLGAPARELIHAGPGVAVSRPQGIRARARRFRGALFLVAPLAFIFVSLFVGRYPLTMPQILEVLWLKAGGIQAPQVPDTHITILWDIRLPRALLGALVGASLATSGAAFQGLFRNPLVSSSILGVSSGAGFGAALAILLMASYSTIYLFAFAFGLLAVSLTYLIGTVYKTTPTIMLVLGGVIVSAIFSSLLSLLKYVADPYNQLPAIVFWLMGSLASARFQDLLFAGVPMTAGLLGLAALRWRINVLSLGDQEARTLGVDVTIQKGLVIFFATMAAAGAVCVSGVIGWVGLVIPHIGRMLVGNDNRALIPVSMSLGACFLVLIDGLARTVTGAELPLGILTSLIGAPFFVYLLKKTKAKGW